MNIHFGSDQFAFFTELIFDPKRNVQPNNLDADADSIAQVERQGKDQGVSKKDVPQPGF